MPFVRIPLSDIVIESRTRRDMGDIEALAMSIDSLGLLHPIVVDSDNKLIAGERRFRAAKKLKWKDIPANRVKSLDDALLALAAERDENTCRKEFTPSEAVAIGQRLEELERPKAKERQAEQARRNQPQSEGGNLPPIEKAKTRDKVGEAVGMSGRTYEKAKAVVESGDEDVIAEMDATGKVDPAYKKITHVTQNTGENEWYTPLFYIDAAREVMGRIDIDPASCETAQEYIKAKEYFTAETDGLSHEWCGNVWLNPPYSKDLVSQFIDELACEVNAGRTKQAIVLLNNATETAWGQAILSTASAVCFPKGRIKFLDKTGSPAGKPLQGQMFCYVGKNCKKFIEVFGAFGVCMEGAT